MSTYEARLAALREQLRADRLDGFGGQWQRPPGADILAFPEFVKQVMREDDSTLSVVTPTCVGPVSRCCSAKP